MTVLKLKRPIAALRAGKRTAIEVAEDRRVVVYARLSTERQYEKENSIEAQLAKWGAAAPAPAATGSTS